MRAESEALLDVADRLADPERPCRRTGRRARRAACWPTAPGPLYDRERVDELPAYLDSTLSALEPESH